MPTKNVLIATALLAALLGAAIPAAAATVYTWQGTADGDWTNAANWDGVGVPVDENTGSAGLNGDMTILFSGTIMPTVNVPGMGGLNGGVTSNTPILDLRSGGTLTVDYVGLQDGLVLNNSPTVTALIVGDGIGGGSEDVTLSVTGRLDLNRHGGSFFTTIVNSDGTLNTSGDLNLAYVSNRHAILDVDGGTVNVGGNLKSMDNTTLSDTSQSEIWIHNGGTIDITGSVLNTVGWGVKIDLLDTTGSFTAHFGNNFANLDAVKSQIGDLFVSSNPALGVQAIDNLDGTFTVTAVPEPGTAVALLTGLIGLVLLRLRRRR